LDEPISPNTNLRPRDRIGLSAHYFFIFAALGFVATFLPLFLRDRGLTLTQIGALSAILALAGAGTQVPLGMLSDRIGRRKPLVIGGGLILGGLYLLLGRIQSFPGFCALYFAIGTLFFTIATLTNALISDWTAGTRSTGRNFGITRIWGSLGFIASLVVASVVPKVSEGGNLLPAITVLYWIGALSIIPVSEPERRRHESQRTFEDLPKLLKNANLSIFLAAFLLYRICENGGISFLSIYLRNLDASRSLIALAFAFNALVEIPFMVWVGGASDRIGRRPPLVIAFLTNPLRLFLYSLLVRPADVFFVQLFHGLTFSFALVGSLAFVADLSPGRLRATGQGLLNMVSALAMAAGPFLGGLVADRTSISAMYVWLAAIALTGGIVFLLFVRESHPELSAERLAARISVRHPLLRPVVKILSQPLLGRAGGLTEKDCDIDRTGRVGL
jgi:MFS family permease